MNCVFFFWLEWLCDVTWDEMRGKSVQAGETALLNTTEVPEFLLLSFPGVWEVPMDDNEGGESVSKSVPLSPRTYQMHATIVPNNRLLFLNCITNCSHYHAVHKPATAAGTGDPVSTSPTDIMHDDDDDDSHIHCSASRCVYTVTVFLLRGRVGLRRAALNRVRTGTFAAVHYGPRPRWVQAFRES